MNRPGFELVTFQSWGGHSSTRTLSWFPYQLGDVVSPACPSSQWDTPRTPPQGSELDQPTPLDVEEQRRYSDLSMSDPASNPKFVIFVKNINSDFFLPSLLSINVFFFLAVSEQQKESEKTPEGSGIDEPVQWFAKKTKH